MIRARSELSAADFCDHVLDTLDITVETRGEEHLLSAERPVVCCNHPTGGVEGLALISILTRVRGACRLPANDLLGLIPPLAPILIPVRHGVPSRDTSTGFAAAFAGDTPILVFPAGVTARVRGGALREYPWRTTFVTRARTSGRDIVPVAASGRNSARFYAIHALRRVLGIGLNIEMMLLLDELLRQRGRTFTLRFLDPYRFPPTEASAATRESARDADRDIARRLQRRVERAARGLSNSVRGRTR